MNFKPLDKNDKLNNFNFSILPSHEMINHNMRNCSIFAKLEILKNRKGPRGPFLFKKDHVGPNMDHVVLEFLGPSGPSKRTTWFCLGPRGPFIYIFFGV